MGMDGKDDKLDTSLKECEEEYDEEMNDVDDLKRKLIACERSKIVLHEQYVKCESELRKKTEEVEVYKTELKDLKEIMKLEKELKEHNIERNLTDDEIEESEEKKSYAQSVRKSNNKKRSTFRDTYKHWDAEFNCEECDFQGTQLMELNKHINLKHRFEADFGNTIKCRSCGDEFSSKWNLMYHRKNKHSNSIAMCRNKLKDQCNFPDDVCWWSHEKKPDVSTFAMRISKLKVH